MTTTRFLHPMMMKKTTARKQQLKRMTTWWKPHHHPRPANARSTPAPTASRPPRNRLHRLLSEPFRHEDEDEDEATGVVECCSDCVRVRVV